MFSSLYILLSFAFAYSPPAKFAIKYFTKRSIGSRVKDYAELLSVFKTCMSVTFFFFSLRTSIFYGSDDIAAAGERSGWRARENRLSVDSGEKKW